MRVLGIDYGSKRVGLALGDTESKLASPWGVIPNEGFDRLTDRISEIIDRDEAERIIVGIPRPLQDPTSTNQQVREVQEFVDVLKTAGVEVEVADEALTSKLSKTLAKEAGVKEKRDDLAAAVMLQGWLDQSAASLS
jgi:putative Holliday junction resolvase